jgi:hypothetical protein
MSKKISKSSRRKKPYNNILSYNGRTNADIIKIDIF